MNIPTYCTNCETSEGVRFKCKGCNFARFCSRDCQKKCWKKHKRYCMPLNDAVNDSIEKARPLLRDKYRIDDQDLHCMFCLEGGTSEDPLFHGGCACRPDSGMSIGHIKCFQEFARASFADKKKKREDSFDCDVNECSHCSQTRDGIIIFEMLLILSKLHDPEFLTRQNVEDIDHEKAIEIAHALKCLDITLAQRHFDAAHNDLMLYSRLRALYLKKIVRKQIHDNVYTRIFEEIAEDNVIGEILIDIRKYQAAIDYNRCNYEKYLLNINEYPEVKPVLKRNLSVGVVLNYAQSLYEAFQASAQKSDVGNDPLFHYLEEAERLMREQVLENRDDMVIHIPNTFLLCRILMAQTKFAEAKQILSPCLQEAQQIFGSSNDYYRKLFELDAHICACISNNVSVTTN